MQMDHLTKEKERKLQPKAKHDLMLQKPPNQTEFKPPPSRVRVGPATFSSLAQARQPDTPIRARVPLSHVSTRAPSPPAWVRVAAS